MPKNSEEIAQIEARKGYLLGEFDIERFREDWLRAKIPEGQLHDFVPIRLVTIIEGCVRAVVSDAIDKGEPYFSRGLSVVSGWSNRAVVDALRAIAHRKLKLGSFVAHGISTGSLDEILASLKAIFGDDVVTSLRGARTRWREPSLNDAGPLMPEADKTFSVIAQLLKVRHILVHESPRESPYRQADLGEFFEHARLFSGALEWMKVERLYGTVPYSQAEMTFDANQRLNKAIEKLDAMRGGASESFKEQRTLNEQMEFYWDQFSDLAARAEAGLLAPGPHGSIAPMLYASARERLVIWRIGELERMKVEIEGEI